MWVEALIGRPLDRKLLRRWTVQFEELKDYLKKNGFNELYAGCSTQARVKWATKMFGFEKVREYPMGTVVHMCF